MIFRLRDSTSNTIYPLTGMIKQIGRGPDCDIVIPDPQVSRLHARLDKTERGWVLVDLDSRNGTRVNREPVREQALTPGDIIQVGSVSLRYEIDDSAREPEESTKVDIDCKETPGILNRVFRPRKK